MHVTSFPPIVGEMPRVLILGSMPGVESLRAKEYYAHPRNAFWKILGDLGLCDPSESYALRTASMQRASVALWDVLAVCERDGSLDASIVRETEETDVSWVFFTAAILLLIAAVLMAFGRRQTVP